MMRINKQMRVMFLVFASRQIILILTEAFLLFNLSLTDMGGPLSLGFILKYLVIVIVMKLDTFGMRTHVIEEIKHQYQDFMKINISRRLHPAKQLVSRMDSWCWKKTRNCIQGYFTCFNKGNEKSKNVPVKV